MSKIALNPNASGTGVFTIASPNSDTDRTLTLPDESGTVLSSSSDYLSSTSDIESQVKTATNASGSAPIYSCRAWVNFNGTGTVAIRASGNVSSITDRGTGLYTINFATAMPDANYSVSGTSWYDGVTAAFTGISGTPSTSAVQVNVDGTSHVNVDVDQASYSIHR